jgi:phytoene dehydrogenase-like protein
VSKAGTVGRRSGSRAGARHAIVVGSGPNGLAAAVVLAEAGWSVVVREAADTAGGGVRSAAITLPGYLHDLGSAVHPLAVSSPIFRAAPLGAHGLDWIHPSAPLAQVMADGPAVLLHRSLEETAAELDGRDGQRYRAMMTPFVEQWDALCSDLLAPTAPVRLPRHPFLMARFARYGLPPAVTIARRAFAGERARALFGGLAAHSILPLTWLGSAAFGVVLGAAAHAVGWPIPRGGSGALSRALVAYLESIGGTVITSAPVRSLTELPPTDALLLDLTPRQVVAVAGDRLAAGERQALSNFQYGPGAFKVDWALSAPIPWRDHRCAQAATVHVSGSLDEMVVSEAAPWSGTHAERPFVLVVQPSLFDPTRAPPGRHTAWGYCHVPNGSNVDMVARLEAQVERFAPGFRDVIAARSVMSPAGLESYDANLVGGDLGGGANTLRQIIFRPVARRVPYATSVRGLFICSSSTPPGGGVHGMCGYHAARAAMAAVGERS